MRGLGWVVLLATGCFGVNIGEGDFACGTGNACPPGFVCDPATDLCVQSIETPDAAPAADVPSQPGNDAPLVADGPVTGDATAPDAASADADDLPDGGIVAEHHHYVTDKLTIPTSSPHALELGFDLDGDFDAEGHPIEQPVNKLGQVMAQIRAYVDLQVYADRSIGEGQVVVLHSLTTASLTTSATATWRVLEGQPFVPPDRPDFSGGGVFAVAGDSQIDALLAGSIVDGLFHGTAPSITVALPVAAGGPPILFRLLSAHLQTAVTVDGCDGKVGGAIPMEDVRGALVPAVAQALDRIIAEDAGCRDNILNCDSTSLGILLIFDVGTAAHPEWKNDRIIQNDEVAENPLVTSLLQPDQDLRDGSGAPGHDGVPDAMSLGLGLSCKKATFDAPNE